MKVGTVVASANNATQLSSFIGREYDLVELRRILRNTRLLTLTGAPGVGKSRVAMELAKKEQRASHRGTVVIDFCAPEMAALEPAGMVEALTATVEEQVAPVLRRDAARTEEQLILLDNCERVLEVCGPSVVGLLFRFPGLRVVATSREPWRLSGEVVYRLSGLSLPSPDAGDPLDGCLRADAVRLFVDRCTAVNHEFALTEENAADVGAICSGLDGLPLALELAAQLCRALPVAEIRKRLPDRLTALNQGWRTADARHRSWQAALQWSYDELCPDEQRLFRRLSLLSGVCSAEAARTAYTDDPVLAETVPDLLIRLEAKSLITSAADGTEESPDFEVPASLRGFGQQKLAACGEEPAVLDRLTTWMTEWTDELRAISPPPRTALGRLARERHTIHRLLARLSATDDERQLSLSGALAAIDTLSNEDAGETLDIVRNALQVTKSTSARRGHALEGALSLACWHGHDRLALELVAEAVTVAGQDCDEDQRARVLLLAGIAKEMYADRDDAYADLRAALEAARRNGNAVLAAMCQGHLARHLLHRGHPGPAADLLAANLATIRAAAPPEQLSAVLLTAGALALARDDLADAEQLFHETLASGHGPGLYDGVLGLALCAARDNSFERALRLMASTENRPAAALRLFPDWRRQLEDTHDIATRILPKARAATALTSGRGLDLGQILLLARDAAVPDAATAEDDVLTAREWEVLRLVMEGLANSQIAHRMHLSVRTVETHVRSIRTALGLRSRAHMAAWAARRCTKAA
ncbi:ATP-binding protein [Actinacidiphila acididurans]|uniref:HTH luxR-type domain-containing protein n=1 Tax=Actinacidiphila acididurans TaxID=2784346 RepID=A0ABS2U2V2_9ACTN|nr:LuxR C-terminal-related transcriptional regulator [Actinacidiphila acididurans]MBM9509925.1 hypothetical protein [Actinacidiphila acididurans]